MKSKHTIFSASLLVVLLLSAFLPAGGGGSTGDAYPRTITVTGNGKVVLAPDIATINVGVHTEDPDVAAALAQNTAKAREVVDTLGRLGVKPEDIQTVNFSIYPIDKYGPDGLMIGKYYSVDNTIYITVRDLARMGETLSAVVEGGANNIYGITFDVADRTKALSDARKAAVLDARAQADELAKLAGVTIARIQNLSISSYAQPVPMYANGFGGGGYMEAAAPVPVSGGQLVISIDAYVTYEIK
ncbi:MAG: SIMPL domain-containing protein [Anaerolineales bacterium]|nr:SIMPL domain-containing protein [Anaerolineales bacterium]